MTNKILTISFYLLFFFTPLVWAPSNYELFEYNKMMLVYFLTIVITSTWLWKMLDRKQLVLKRTPLDIPLLLFLMANIISTITSIDPHTSIWGYYSRSNGGLLSLVSYLLLYYALVSNFDKTQVLGFLKAAILGGFLVAIYAIPEHFGVSPSCVWLTGEFNASCWVQDVQSRVFATLGQPNWLAAYLAMLIFPAIYFAFTAKTTLSRITYYLILTIYYLAFTFTYSRGGTLGLIGGLITFSPLFLLIQAASSTKKKVQNLLKSVLKLNTYYLILATFLIINLFFGSALTDFKLISKFAPPPRASITTAVTSTTQLEAGGTESGKIRLIVWQGALEIFKHYPLFGSGLETFAYTYYNFRPTEHNLVSEWDYLYNKAHNEFLNYLATTGILGFLSYSIIITTFIIFIIKKPGNNYLLSYSLLAAYISYLIQNFFGFSVVIIALFFYLFPALAFLAADSTKPLQIPKFLISHFSLLTSILYRRPLYPFLSKVIIISIFGLFFLKLVSYYQADLLFAAGHRANETGNAGRAYNKLVEATDLNPGEPLYKSELGFAAAGASVSLASEDASLSAQLKNQAITETEQALKIGPKNISHLRTAIRTYYLLSTVDPAFTQKTLDTLNETSTLAPTDPKLVYNKGLILEQMNREDEALVMFQKTIEMKPDYKEAYLALGQAYIQAKQVEKAIDSINTLLKYYPNDPEALAKQAEWSK